MCLYSAWRDKRGRHALNPTCWCPFHTNIIYHNDKKKLMANDNEEEFKKSNFLTNNKQQCHGYVFSTKLFLQCKMIRVIGKLFVNKFTVTYQPFVIHLQGHFFFFLLFIFLLHFLYFLLLAFCPYLLFNDILLSVTPM